MSVSPVNQPRTKRVLQVADGSHRRRRRWPWTATAVVAAGVLTWWLLGAGSDSGENPAGETASSFADVVVTDLIETEEFAGTLGRTVGDPIISRLDGTITGVAEAGTTVDAGDVLYWVDDQPVALLLGGEPAWRDIGFEADAETIANRLNGTVTNVPATGTEVADGDTLYFVDQEPVIVFLSDIPAYRTMRQGTEGPDVEQLEAALVGLYDPDGTVTVDQDFTSNTEAMVERWQEEIGADVDGVVDFGEVVFLSRGFYTIDELLLKAGDPVRDGEPVMVLARSGDASLGADVLQLEQGLDSIGYDTGIVDGTFDDSTETGVVRWQTDIGAEPDGVVDLGEVIFLPASIRVTDELAVPGTPIRDGGAVLATSAAETVVTVDLPAADQGAMVEGDTVTIVLPDDSTTPGTVVEVGTVASSDGQGNSTFEVSIVLDDPGAASGLDEAPVDVEVITDSREGVMAVPVTALIALREGGYAVEVLLDGGGTGLVGVEAGFYSSGLVEVTSGVLSPGDQVVVP